MRPWRDDQLVDVAAGRDDGGGKGLDEIRQVGVRKVSPHRAQGRRGEDDVADFPQADQEDTAGIQLPNPEITQLPNAAMARLSLHR